jgi:hypothetical protein
MKKGPNFLENFLNKPDRWGIALATTVVAYY